MLLSTVNAGNELTVFVSRSALTYTMAEPDKKKKRKKSSKDESADGDEEFMIKPEKTTPKLDTSR